MDRVKGNHHFVSSSFCETISKLEEKYNLPNTDEAVKPSEDGCSLVLFDYIQQRISDVEELPELESLIKEEMVQRQKYKESNGMSTVIN